MRAVRFSVLAALAAAAVFLAACAVDSPRPAEPGPAAPGPAAEGPWVRLDLWSRRPRVDLRPPGMPRRTPPFTAEESWLGAAEVRDLERLPAAVRHGLGPLPAARVRVLSQRAGSRLAWRLDVPPFDPYLTLTPLGSRGGACPCLFRAGVLDADGVIHELYRTPVEPVRRSAPAAVEIDLGRFAGTRVDVLLQVDPPPGGAPAGDGLPAALWASPAVYGRLAPGEDPGPWDRRRRGAAASGGGAARTGGGEQDRPVNVLLLGLDTLRRDAVGPRRNAPSLTPNLDALAAEADVWDSAFSTFNSTNPSFASIMTGLYGKNHGVYDLKTPLPEPHVTLAELFADAGYRTFAALAARHMSPVWSGLGAGFDEVAVSELFDAGELIADRGIEWLAGRGEPWFAWLHFFDPHTPHTAPRPYALGFRHLGAAGLGPVAGWLPYRQPGPLVYSENRFGGSRELYDAEVAYLDRQLGRVLDFLASRGALDHTVVAVVADHGESLGEHGILCSHVGLHDPTTHVPLIVRWPERLLDDPAWLPRRGRRYSGLVQTIDLFPTLLAAAGLEVPASDGVDLRRLTPRPDGPDPGADPGGRRYVFAEHADRVGAMVRTRSWKYILSEGNPNLPDGASLFDLERDPGETVDLAGRGLEAEERLAELLARWRAAVRPAPDAQAAPLSEEDRERLRSLGYLR